MQVLLNAMDFSSILKQKYPDINDQFLSAIAPHVISRDFKKSDYIYKGDGEGFLGFQLHGISRFLSYDNNGNEKTTDFNQTGDFINIESNTSTWLQAVNSNTIAFIPAKILDSLLISYPELNKHIADIYKFCLLQKNEQLEKLMTLDAKQRYQSFLNDFPQLASELQLGQIASYLGINQASLSRIRRTE